MLTNHHWHLLKTGKPDWLCLFKTLGSLIMQVQRNSPECWTTHSLGPVYFETAANGEKHVKMTLSSCSTSSRQSVCAFQWQLRHEGGWRCLLHRCLERTLQAPSIFPSVRATGELIRPNSGKADLAIWRAHENTTHADATLLLAWNKVPCLV